MKVDASPHFLVAPRLSSSCFDGVWWAGGATLSDAVVKKHTEEVSKKVNHSTGTDSIRWIGLEPEVGHPLYSRAKTCAVAALCLLLVVELTKLIVLAM